MKIKLAAGAAYICCAFILTPQVGEAAGLASALHRSSLAIDSTNEFLSPVQFQRGNRGGGALPGGRPPGGGAFPGGRRPGGGGGNFGGGRRGGDPGLDAALGIIGGVLGAIAAQQEAERQQRLMEMEQRQYLRQQYRRYPSRRR